jgi:hypothetical protein
MRNAELGTFPQLISQHSTVPNVVSISQGASIDCQIHTSDFSSQKISTEMTRNGVRSSRAASWRSFVLIRKEVRGLLIRPLGFPPSVVLRYNSRSIITVTDSYNDHESGRTRSMSLFTTLGSFNRTLGYYLNSGFVQRDHGIRPSYPPDHTEMLRSCTRKLLTSKTVDRIHAWTLCFCLVYQINFFVDSRDTIVNHRGYLLRPECAQQACDLKGALYALRSVRNSK